jgi:hypothetical protein
MMQYIYVEEDGGNEGSGVISVQNGVVLSGYFSWSDVGGLTFNIGAGEPFANGVFTSGTLFHTGLGWYMGFEDVGGSAPEEAELVNESFYFPEQEIYGIWEVPEPSASQLFLLSLATFGVTRRQVTCQHRCNCNSYPQTSP